VSWVIYQYRDARGGWPIGDWYDQMNDRETARFDWCIWALSQNGPEEFGDSWCVLQRGGIRKVKIKGGRGTRQLRLMICKGPVNMRTELTLLLPAVEKDGKLDPENAVDRAIERMNEVKADPNGRRGKWTKS
jgi:hypothetical protein